MRISEFVDLIRARWECQEGAAGCYAVRLFETLSEDRLSDTAWSTDHDPLPPLDEEPTREAVKLGVAADAVDLLFC